MATSNKQLLWLACAALTAPVLPAISTAQTPVSTWCEQSRDDLLKMETKQLKQVLEQIEDENKKLAAECIKLGRYKDQLAADAKALGEEIGKLKSEIDATERNRDWARGECMRSVLHKTALRERVDAGTIGELAEGAFYLGYACCARANTDSSANILLVDRRPFHEHAGDVQFPAADGSDGVSPLGSDCDLLVVGARLFVQKPVRVCLAVLTQASVGTWTCSDRSEEIAVDEAGAVDVPLKVPLRAKWGDVFAVYFAGEASVFFDERGTGFVESIPMPSAPERSATVSLSAQEDRNSRAYSFGPLVYPR